MRITKSFSSALLVSIFAILGLSTVANAERPWFWPSCAYVESGAPGPEGNFLKVRAVDSSIGLSRFNDRIIVFTTDSPVRWRTFGVGVMRCDGPRATVRNIDEIRIGQARDAGRNGGLVIDQSGKGFDRGDGPGRMWASKGGPFAPGATSEDGTSEIEIRVSGSRNEDRQLKRPPLVFAGSDRDDFVAAKYRRGLVQLYLSIGKNTNREDGPDLTVGLNASDVLVHGSGGDDAVTLDGLGDSRLSKKLRGWEWGGPGNDRLFGHAGRDFLDGHGGNDVLRAGLGDDGNTGGGSGLYGGKGDDVLVGGPGSDEFSGGVGFDHVFAGSGRDYIMEREGHRDRIDCGSGVKRELSLQFDPALDRLTGCTGASK